MRTDSLLLFLAQFVAHIGLVFMFTSGAELDEWIICFFVYFLTGCFGMSMTFHRLLSHRSWSSPRWFLYIGTILGSLGLTGTAIAWVAIHRDHHRYPDKKEDPHSPHFQPWWEVQFLSMFRRPNLRLVKDLLRDRFLIAMHRNYLYIQLTFVCILALIDMKAVVYAYLAPAAILWHGGSLINTMGHLWGYKNYSTRDHGVNNPILGILMWGEGWHNNHHARPRDANFGVKFWELDVSYLFIRIIIKTRRPSLENKV